jgi:hypothetical protein
MGHFIADSPTSSVQARTRPGRLHRGVDAAFCTVLQPGLSPLPVARPRGTRWINPGTTDPLVWPTSIRPRSTPAGRVLKVRSPAAHPRTRTRGRQASYRTQRPRVRRLYDAVK